MPAVLLFFSRVVHRHTYELLGALHIDLAYVPVGQNLLYFSDPLCRGNVINRLRNAGVFCWYP